MKTLRGCLLTVVLVLVMIMMGGSASWLYAASSLPNALESELDVELHLRQSIESERMALELGKREREKQSVKWERPDFSHFPKHLVALYITETGCPTYFQTPREVGLPWAKRILYSVFDKPLDGDGGCELIYARRLSRLLGASTPMQLVVASDRVHRFLQKDQLVAYDLSTTHYARGVVGVESMSLDVLMKPVDTLTLAELAELAVALPPNGNYDELRSCRNEPLLRQARDVVLQDAQRFNMITAEQSKAASLQPLRCVSVKR